MYFASVVYLSGLEKYTSSPNTYKQVSKYF